MAQAVHSGIIDLTGEDESDDNNARARTAYEKAFAAASQLTDHFESMKSSKPSPYISPNDTVNLGERIPLPAASSKSLGSPRPGTLPNPARFETKGLKKDEGKKPIPREDSPLRSPDVSIPRPRSAIGIVASKPAKSPSLSKKAQGNKRQPKTMPVTRVAESSPVRTPRSAAIFAKQNIAQTCNELEQWVNTDPNLRPRQAGVSTPRKPGRPKADPEEWSPTSSLKHKVEERKGQGRVITHSPTPSAGKHGDLITNESNRLSRIEAVSTSLGTKKRKYSGSPGPHNSPVKLARWKEGSNACHDCTPPNSAEPTSGKHAHDRTGNSSPAGCFPKCVYPAIKAAKVEYKQILTENALTGIGKSVCLLLESQDGVSYACRPN